MSTPRFYSWDDDGSPGRALSGNLQNRLKQILVPCLVTGYGSKPGAGWTVGHEHANGFSLINADGNVVNFVSNLPAQAPYPAMNASAIHIYVAESLSDSSAAVIAGANLCSGPYRFGSGEAVNYPRHGVNAQGVLQQNLTSLKWTIIADDRTVVMAFSTDVSGQSGSSARTLNHLSMYCGDSVSDIGLTTNFVALGGDNTNYNLTSGLYTLCRGFTAPRNLLTGIAEHTDTYTEPFMSYVARFDISTTLLAPPAHVNLQAPRIWVSNSYVGRTRGIAYDDILALHGWSAYLKALGFIGSDFGDRGTVVTIGAYQYAYAMGYNGGFVMTNDPAFW